MIPILADSPRTLLLGRLEVIEGGNGGDLSIIRRRVVIHCIMKVCLILKDKLVLTLINVRLILLGEAIHNLSLDLLDQFLSS